MSRARTKPYFFLSAMTCLCSQDMYLCMCVHKDTYTERERETHTHTQIHAHIHTHSHTFPLTRSHTHVLAHACMLLQPSNSIDCIRSHLMSRMHAIPAPFLSLPPSLSPPLSLPNSLSSLSQRQRRACPHVGKQLCRCWWQHLRKGTWLLRSFVHRLSSFTHSPS